MLFAMVSTYFLFVKRGRGRSQDKTSYEIKKKQSLAKTFKNTSFRLFALRLWRKDIAQM